MMNNFMEYTNDFKTALEAAKHHGTAIIAGHTDPDGDCVGACFALALAFTQIGVKPVILLESFGDSFAYLNGAEYIFTGDLNGVNITAPFFAVDCADKTRLGRFAGLLSEDRLFINIDHHRKEFELADNLGMEIDITDTAAAATCELLFHLLKNVGIEITKDIAAALYTGIVTDTGGFRHKSTTSGTMRVSAILMEAGIDFNYIRRKNLHEHTAKQAYMLALAVSSMKVYDDCKLAIGTVEHSQFIAYDAVANDFEGVADYLLNTEGVEVAALITGREVGSFNISLRSLYINTQNIAVKLGGGGHVHASGCKFSGSLEEAKALLLSLVVEEQARGGIVCVYKPPGMTSHDVVNRIKRTYKLKTGHTGTLDPEAEGVLPILIGKATKLSDKMMASDKSYRVEIIFGEERDTQDATGNVTKTAPLTAIKSSVIDTINSFIGEISQTPPMYSAIKIDGKKLYELARKGVTVERAPRLVKIFGIDVVELELPYRAVIDVRCSKGTYMRTLCEDIGRALSSAAHMGKLVRTEAARFTLDDAVPLDKIIKSQNPRQYIILPESRGF
ncbi:MAG: tRNA pseudouridine(55) synthase TruB [Defluviitaleaceae bacterium]|nr:tRNA pseudouridine(55) synthase TruB [Defluviitaleaceae bacterium]